MGQYAFVFRVGRVPLLRRHGQSFRVSEMAQLGRELLPCRNASPDVPRHYRSLLGVCRYRWDGAGRQCANRPAATSQIWVLTEAGSDQSAQLLQGPIDHRRRSIHVRIQDKRIVYAWQAFRRIARLEFVVTKHDSCYRRSQAGDRRRCRKAKRRRRTESLFHRARQSPNCLSPWRAASTQSSRAPM